MLPVVLVFALVVANPEAAALRAEGQRLFRAKSYVAACSKFEAAIRLVPDDPEPLADLALCEQRAGHDDRARELDQKVIALGAAPPARRADERFARQRRHAYFNLDRLGRDLQAGGGVPRALGDREQGCAPMSAEPGCPRRLYACAVSKSDGWSGRLLDMTHVRVGATEEAVRFSEDDILDLPEADFDGFQKEVDARPPRIADGDSLDYVASYHEEGRDYMCDDKEWSCDESAAVGAAALICTNAAKAQGKLPAELLPDCKKKACARATSKPWPAVRREQAAIKTAEDDCFKSAANVDGELACNIVHANACTGLVGLVCSGHAGGEKKTRTRVEEYLFETAK